MNDTDLPLPDLDKLHAEATPAPWSRCECGKCGLVWSDPAQTTVLQGAARRMVTALCGEDNDDCPPVTPEQQQANGELIVALVNTWPTISARLKELESNPGLRAGGAIESEAVAELRARVDELEIMDKFYSEILEKRGDRIDLLEETIRGVLQEKREALTDPVGPTVSKLEQQIAWLESVLGGGK